MCPQCGYAMSAFDKDCQRCHGQGIAQSDTGTQRLPTATPKTPRVQAVSPVPLASMAPAMGATSSCNRCGAPNANAASFCSTCGESLSALSVGAPASPSGTWATTNQQSSPQPYQQPYPHQQPHQQPHPPQNNVNVVVTQKNGSNAGWWAAALLLMFGTPLGCIAIPIAIVLMAIAFRFAPMIIAGYVALLITRSTLEPEKKTIGIVIALVVGAAFTQGLIALNALLRDDVATRAVTTAASAS